MRARGRGSNIYFTASYKNIFYYGEKRKIEKHALTTHRKKHDTENLSLRKLSPGKVCLASAHTDQPSTDLTTTLKLDLSALTQHTMFCRNVAQLNRILKDRELFT